MAMSISVPNALKQAPKPKVVTGQRLAKATVTYPVWRRAEDAVRWLRGELVVRPTVALACSTFGISYPSLKRAQAMLDEQRERTKHHGNGNGNGTTVLSDAVIDGIVAEVGHDRIFAALDRATQPQLPLQAAEWRS
jgi:hypothetical protein